MFVIFFFKVTATPAIYSYCHTLSLHDALPICCSRQVVRLPCVPHLWCLCPLLRSGCRVLSRRGLSTGVLPRPAAGFGSGSRSSPVPDRKSTRLNSSH